MTDRLSDLAEEHLVIHEWCEHLHQRPLEPEEIEQIAEEVVEMHEEPPGGRMR